MRFVFIGVLGLFILSNCGKDEISRGPAPSPTDNRSLVTNIPFSPRLTQRGLSEQKNCAQLVRVGDNLTVELSATACPASGLSRQVKIRLDVLESAVPASKVDPVTTFYLYERLMLVGTLTKTGNDYSLTEVCTNTYFKASCELRMTSDGVLVSLFPLPRAAVDRMVTEGDLRKEKGELFEAVSVMREELSKNVRALRALNGRLSYQKDMLLKLVEKQVLSLEPIQKSLTDAEPNLLTQINENSKKVQDLNTVLENGAGYLKGKEAELTEARKKLTAAEEDLAQKTQKKAETEKKNETAENKRLARRENRQGAVDVGKSYTTFVAEKAAFEKLELAYKDSEEKHADNLARRQLQLVKEQLRQVQQTATITKEILADLEVTRGKLAKVKETTEHNQIEDAMKTIPELSGDLKMILYRVTLLPNQKPLAL